MSRLLFNPFEKIAGLQALLLGLLLMTIGAVLAALCHARYDGVIDLHFVVEINFWEPFSDQLISWLTLSAVFYMAALICGARPRPIDIIGTFALARAPFTLVPLINSTGFITRITQQMATTERQEFSMTTSDTLYLVLLLTPVILAVIWMVSLYLKAYKTSTNLKGNKLIVSFIAGLLVSEIVVVYLTRTVFNY
jgi:hypothetical protein